MYTQRLKFLALSCCLTVIVGFGSNVAKAHPVIDQGISAYQRAEFALALKEFRDAELHNDLTYDDLLQLLEMRALVYYAMGDEKSMASDLRRLASIRPTHLLSKLAPPPVRKTFDLVRQSIAGAIEVEVSVRAFPGKLEFRSEVLRDVDQIGRALNIFTRVRGERDWTVGSGALHTVELTDGGIIEYYVELVGPGGATIVSNGNRQNPRIAEVPPVDWSTVKFPVPKSVIWLWSSAGAAGLGAAAAGAIALKRNRQLENGCGANTPSLCTEDQRDRVKRPALIADVLIGAAVVTGVTGTVLYLVKKKAFRGQKKKAAEKVETEPKEGAWLHMDVAPWYAGTAGGLVLSGDF